MSVSEDNDTLPVSLLARPHMLEWHAANCITLSEKCQHKEARHVLRQLAADLLIEAQTQRAWIRKRQGAAQERPGGRSSALIVAE
jgi:hypothetical protein